MSEAKEDLRKSEDAILSALQDAGADVTRPKAIKCPFHEDTSPSAGIKQGRDGAWRFSCFAAGCGFHGDVFDIRARASGRPVEDVLREFNRANGGGKPEQRAGDKPKPAAPQIRRPPAVEDKPREYESIGAFVDSCSNVVDKYLYTDPATGNVDLIKLRIEAGGKKRFLQAHLKISGKDGVVVVTAPPAPRPLFNRMRMVDASEVFFVEGEKAAKALTRAGFVATCCSGGGAKGSPKYTDLTPLDGKTIYFWPDHDPAKDGVRAGHAHMREVIEEANATGVQISPYWIDPEDLGLGPKEDAFDYIARFAGEPEAVVDAVDAAKGAAAALGKPSLFRQYMLDAIDGRVQTIPFAGFSVLSRLTKALQPGTITLLCGEGGATKSMMIMQLFGEWTQGGVHVAVYMLEDDVNMHVRRALAQLSGISDMTDTDWLRANGDVAREQMAKHAPLTDRLLDRMDDAPDQPPSHGECIEWIRNRCAEGARILIIDPVTAIDGGDQVWRSDLDFIIKAKSIARRGSTSLIFVTHPRSKAPKQPSLDDIAGGRAWPRFVQTVLWIQYRNAIRMVQSNYGPSVNERVDRMVHLLKVRNGRGERRRVAFKFDPSSLRFKELGLDVGDATGMPAHSTDDDNVPDGV